VQNLEAALLVVLVPHHSPALVLRPQEAEQTLPVVARARAQDLLGRPSEILPVDVDGARRRPERFESRLL
jgi:hypothetical protein